jgi:hypothetical protein
MSLRLGHIAEWFEVRDLQIDQPVGPGELVDLLRDDALPVAIPLMRRGWK